MKGSIDIEMNATGHREHIMLRITDRVSGLVVVETQLTAAQIVGMLSGLGVTDSPCTWRSVDKVGWSQEHMRIPVHVPIGAALDFTEGRSNSPLARRAVREMVAELKEANPGAHVTANHRDAWNHHKRNPAGDRGDGTECYMVSCSVYRPPAEDEG